MRPEQLSGNPRAVLRLLAVEGPRSRAALAKDLGLSRASISGIVRELIETDFVRETVPADLARGPGRPGALVRLNPEAGAVVGVEFRHNGVHACIANVGHEIVAGGGTPYRERTSWRRRADLAGDLIKELGASAPTGLDSVLAIGVGLTGPVDERRASARVVEEQLGAMYAVPTVIDNNVRLAGYAEARWGAGAGARDLVYIGLDTGIGGAVFINGRLVHGSSGVAGEFGHVTLETDGAACRCGRTGCLEAYASTTAVLQTWRPAGGATLEDLHAALAAGDETAFDVMDRAGQRIARVLAQVCDTLNPSHVVVGGRLPDPGGVLLRAIRAGLREHTTASAFHALQVCRATLGPDAGVTGAAAIALAGQALLAESAD